MYVVSFFVPAAKKAKAKKGGRKRRVAIQASGSSLRDNEHNDIEAEVRGMNFFAIDNRDDNDPLVDVTDPLQHMQIKALMAKKKRKIAKVKRKQELHGLDVRQRETQYLIYPLPPFSSCLPDNDLLAGLPGLSKLMQTSFYSIL